MTRFTVAGFAAVAMVSAAAGWFVGHDQPLSVSHTDAPTPNVQPSPAADRVQVIGDGTVSVQVRRAPLRWLLDELARQGAEVPPTSSAPPLANQPAAKPVSTPSAESKEDSDSDKPDTVEALAALRGNDETARVAALEQVSSGDAVVPAELLQQLVNSDPSETIREEAFRALVELRYDDPDALHQVLEAGLTNSSATVRAESSERLATYDQRRAAQADSGQ